MKKNSSSSISTIGAWIEKDERRGRKGYFGRLQWSRRRKGGRRKMFMIRGMEKVTEKATRPPA